MQDAHMYTLWPLQLHVLVHLLVIAFILLSILLLLLALLSLLLSLLVLVLSLLLGIGEYSDSNGEYPGLYMKKMALYFQLTRDFGSNRFGPFFPSEISPLHNAF